MNSPALLIHRASRKLVLGLVLSGGLASSAIAASDELFEYDNLGRLTKVTYSSGAAIEYSYDEVGNRTSKVVSLALSAVDDGN